MLLKNLGLNPGHTPFLTLPRAVQLYTFSTVIACGLVIWIFPHGRIEIMGALVAIFAAATLMQPVPMSIGGVLVPNLPLILIAALLWRPEEVLVGAAVGSFLGLLVFRRLELWRAGLNGALIGLPIAAAAEAASTIMASASTRGVVLQIVVAAVAALVVYGALHVTLFACYRMLRFRQPFMPDWLYHFARNPGNQVIATPLAVVLAAVDDHLSGDPIIGLVLTAACALALPLARQELAYYHQSQQMLEEIVETVIGVLDRMMPGAREHSERVSAIAVETGLRLGLSEQAIATLRLAARLHDVGLLTGPAASRASHGRSGNGRAGGRLVDQLPDRLIAAIIQAHHERWVDREGHRPQRRSMVSIAASILAAAELYDSARAGIRPFERPVSQEAVERELTMLAGSTLDPEVVPVVLSVGHELSAELVGAY